METSHGGAGAMQGNRRDYPRRAKTLRAIMQRLLACAAGARLVELVDDGVPARAVKRILSLLALSGFVRHRGDLWIPTPLFLGATGSLTET